MLVEIQIHQKVYEIATAVIKLTEEEVKDYIGGATSPESGVENYLMERMEMWYDTVYISHDEVIGPDGDAEIFVTIIENTE